MDQACGVALLGGDLGIYTYRWTLGEEQGALERGVRVLAPLGSRTVAGVVVEPQASWPDGDGGARLRDLEALLDPLPLGEEDWLSFLEWTAAYYLCPVGAAIEAALPPALRKGVEPVLRVSASAGRTDLGRRLRARLGRPAGSPEEIRRALDLSPSRLRRLVSEGLLEAGGRPRLERLYRYERNVEVSARATVEQAVLAHLRHAGTASRREVLARWPSAGRALARLVEKGALREEEASPVPADGACLDEEERPVELTAQQREAVDAVAAPGEQPPALLHGVTGSGKTEVYLRLAEQTLREGGSVLLLVPEIGLTPALLGRVRARFGDEAAVLHSGLTPAARLGEWWRVRSGRARLVLGARSAVFAPLPGLGLVVVDEEHEDAYKQETGLRYHARDLALARAKLCGARVVLGSATPSAESSARARAGLYKYLRLPERAGGQSLPAVEVVDLRQHAASGRPGPRRGRAEDEDPPALSEPMVDDLRKTYARGEQSIVLLNRRGFAPWVVCRCCGEALGCPSCSVSLAWHRRPPRAVCHLCGHAAIWPQRCPSCGEADSLLLRGHGTDRIFDELEAALPGARVARLDRDTGGGLRGAGVLRAMAAREIDVLVGTQMVAKGHDFPNVTFVGVVLAEQALRLPDFRGAERTFQLLTQVAGRAGRGDVPGRVLLQTWLPEHPAIRFAAAHDTVGFLDSELAFRSRAGYPPNTHLALVELHGRHPDRVQTRAAELLDAALRHASPEVEILGPAPAAIPVVRGRTRAHLLLKCASRPPLRAAARALLAGGHLRRRGGVHTILDVDPRSFM